MLLSVCFLVQADNLLQLADYFANSLRKVWDFESRQSRRWLVAKQKAGSISGAAADVLHEWTRAKSPEEQGRLSKLSDNMLSSNSEKEAHRAWTTFKMERQEAMRKGGDGVRVADWWCKDASQGKETGELDGMEDVEDGEEAEEGGCGDDSDALSVVSEGDDVDEEEEEDDDDEMELEPPEPVSPA